MILNIDEQIWQKKADLSFIYLFKRKIFVDTDKNFRLKYPNGTITYSEVWGKKNKMKQKVDLRLLKVEVQKLLSISI